MRGLTPFQRRSIGKSVTGRSGFSIIWRAHHGPKPGTRRLRWPASHAAIEMTSKSDSGRGKPLRVAAGSLRRSLRCSSKLEDAFDELATRRRARS